MTGCAFVDRWVAELHGFADPDLTRDERVDRDLMLLELDGIRFGETELRQDALISWPEPVAADRDRLHVARPVLARLGRVGSARGAHRPPARAQHHARRASSGSSARRTSLIVLGLGHAAHRQREDAARPVDARRGRRGAAVGSGAGTARRLATRRVYGEGHAPDEVLRTFGSRLTRALPLDELLLQLAESLKATMNLEVAEVWTQGRRPARARGVGARPRARR